MKNKDEKFVHLPDNLEEFKMTDRRKPPMSTNGFVQEVAEYAPPVAVRHKLPKDRKATTVTFTLGADEYKEQFYLTVGLFPDGSPGELFIHTSKSGSTINGLLDAWAITVSLALQHGVPLRAICDKLSFTKFEPDGMTGKEFGFATSVIDYIVRYLAKRYLNHDYREQVA